MLFRQIFDPKLAQYAYLVGCQATKEAIIIDPERDIDQYIAIAEKEGLNIVAVTETHIHADFLSGAREFAERLGTKVYVSDEGDEDWKYEWVKEKRQNGSPYDYVMLKDGDTFSIGNIEIQTLHTPGHTPEHLSFLVTDLGGGADKPMGMISGDFVFVNDLGRPDLLESAAHFDGMMEPSARTLYQTVQRFLKMPDYLQVWPAHGAGSACGKALGAVPQTTVGYERHFNPSIAAAKQGEDDFVAAILAGQPEPPMYFARMKRDNKLGVPILGELPAPRRLSTQELADLNDRTDIAVVDTRIDRSAFMAHHLKKSLYAPMNKSFNTVVGSLVPDETTPIYLITEDDHVDSAVRDLVRIGYDNIVGYADPETLVNYINDGGAVETIREIGLSQMESLRSTNDVTVVDVRYKSEFDEGHVPGAVNASYTRLPEYETRVPGNKPLLVHCKTGGRAAAATAYLARLGRDVTLVDGEFERYADIGTPVVEGETVPV